jgi:hypothetical protein
LACGFGESHGSDDFLDFRPSGAGLAGGLGQGFFRDVDENKGAAFAGQAKSDRLADPHRRACHHNGQ